QLEGGEGIAVDDAVGGAGAVAERVLNPVQSSALGFGLEGGAAAAVVLPVAKAGERPARTHRKLLRGPQLRRSSLSSHGRPCAENAGAETIYTRRRLVVDFAQPGTNVYDLGCSTCNSFLNIGRVMPPDADVRFVGVDDSEEMMDKARSKLTAAKFNRPFDLRTADLNMGVEVSNASVV